MTYKALGAKTGLHDTTIRNIEKKILHKVVMITQQSLPRWIKKKCCGSVMVTKCLI